MFQKHVLLATSASITSWELRQFQTPAARVPKVTSTISYFPPDTRFTSLQEALGIPQWTLNTGFTQRLSATELVTEGLWAWCAWRPAGLTLTPRILTLGTRGTLPQTQTEPK